MRATGRLLCLVLALGSAAGAYASGGRQGDPAVPVLERLAGRYLLRPQQSEDARAKLKQAGSWRKAGGLGRPGGFGRPGGRDRAPDAPERDRETDLRDETLMRRLYWLDATEIRLESEGDTLVLDVPRAGARTLHVDGERREVPGEGEVSARWDETRLVVETRTEDGSLKEVWRLTNDGRRLTIEGRIERPWGPGASVRRVLERASDASDGARDP